MFFLKRESALLNNVLVTKHGREISAYVTPHNSSATSGAWNKRRSHCIDIRCVADLHCFGMTLWFLPSTQQQWMLQIPINYSVDPDDGSWFTATRRRKPKTTINSGPESLHAYNQVTPPVYLWMTLRCVFRPREGLRRLSEWDQSRGGTRHLHGCWASGRTVKQAPFRFQAERNIAIANAPDDTLATKCKPSLR
ncbi:hypothetical protein HPB51_026112 [Rhipicephalus microplus]|uniref:Uncharacterized protein n=1 Tax=Rhipicephalus microplus TaxID=6941 RepID=A0A9J6F9K0_RHIMP|nr:hypothetical protein HPB51_026112 [Rhipicephalus microplus]